MLVAGRDRHWITPKLQRLQAAESLRFVKICRRTALDFIGMSFFETRDAMRRCAQMPDEDKIRFSETVILKCVVPGSLADGQLLPGERVSLINGTQVSDPAVAAGMLRSASASGEIVLGVLPAHRKFDLSEPFTPNITPAEEEEDRSESGAIALEPRGLPPSKIQQERAPFAAAPLLVHGRAHRASEEAMEEQRQPPVAPSALFVDDSDAICAVITIPAGAMGCVSVDVWPKTEPKFIVTKAIPHGLAPGATFVATLIEASSRGRPGCVNGSLVRPKHGSLDFCFEASGSLGLLIELRHLGPKGYKPQLVVGEVLRGTWAERLNVPVGSTLTHINGHTLSGSGKRQIKHLQKELDERQGPIKITVFVQPPTGTSKAKGPKKTPWLNFRKPARHTGSATPILATPPDTDRSSTQERDRKSVV